MIYTLTLNPSIDYIVNVKDLKIGEVNRSFNEIKFPGGKGINVSRILSELNIENTALGYIGGFTGRFIEESLTELNIKTDFIKVNGDNRINVKIKSDEESEINGAGPDISEENVQALLDRLNALNEGDYLILAGSIQKSLPEDLYLKIQDMLKEKNVCVVVDTSGQALLEALKRKPFLIKPNDKEIEEIFNIKLNGTEDVIEYGKKLYSLGARNVIISRGGEGAILICEDGVFKGNAPKGVVQNSVGAGDSLVGGFVGTFSKTGDILESFKYGIATGSASAFSLDLCTKNDIEKLLKEINIEKI
ncbi:MAG: 1-phosphofructokinase [Clostridium sp.]|uniref:1-phosphofructokinase n=1 Tax=Clostridium sp. TaxID=1506 RepID=UPI003F397EB4